MGLSLQAADSEATEVICELHLGAFLPQRVSRRVKSSTNFDFCHPKAQLLQCVFVCVCLSVSSSDGGEMGVGGGFETKERDLPAKACFVVTRCKPEKLVVSYCFDSNKKLWGSFPAVRGNSTTLRFSFLVFFFSFLE